MRIARFQNVGHGSQINNTRATNWGTCFRLPCLVCSGLLKTQRPHARRPYGTMEASKRIRGHCKKQVHERCCVPTKELLGYSSVTNINNSEAPLGPPKTCHTLRPRVPLHWVIPTMAMNTQYLANMCSLMDNW
jgi:hypothetical protein